MERVHRQSHGFTCGPAALLSVMHGIDEGIPLDHDTELDLWRDANLAESYATSAHGLALAALKRGFKARVRADRPGIGFDGALKRHFPAIEVDILWSMYEHTVSRARSLGLEEEFGPVGIDDLSRIIASGLEPIVLISTSLMDEARPIPHWVVALSVDEREVVIANPETGSKERYRRDKFISSMGYEGYKAILCIWR
jgi:hypothetical protein